MGFSGDSEVRAAGPWVRQKRLMVREDLKLMESIEVVRRVSVVHESVAVKKRKFRIREVQSKKLGIMNC